ncbi:MAG: VCBS repeat-containing protein [Bacteroidales bacterium]|nr:VCBS repeat-containing protein [Bacteroidales bacterium]
MVGICGGGAWAQMPDNVLNTNCMYFAETRAWSVVEDWHSTQEFCARIIPLVGDVNGDGVPELIVFAPDGSYYYTSKLYVYDTRTHDIVHTISLPARMKIDHAAPYGILKMPQTASASVAGHVFAVVALSSKTMYAYDLTANGTSPVWSVTGTTFDAPTVAFSDFNCDGHPEVYIGNRIYDAETGTLLCSTSGSNVGKATGHASGAFCVASFAADVTGNGRPDLILGNEVYNVSITNRSGTSGNSLTLAASCTPPSSLPADGHAQVADFNLDGYLDVLITNKRSTRGDASLYVWDVHNNTVSTPVIESQCYEGMSIPLLADVDNDGTVEVVWQTAYCPHSNPGNNMRAYKYNPNTRTFSELWQLRIHDDSFSVPATIFDLNNDGYNDLLITDDDGIRILNGSGKSHLTGRDTLAVYEESPTFRFRANTTMQYAVVADVDGSGCAKIVALGKSGGYSGYIYVFRSVDDPWMPARKVWNQYLYNVTCVNEDLTIPQYPFNNAMQLTDPVTGVVRRPYNNCLQQATAIDIYGRKVTITADVNQVTVTPTVVADSVLLNVRWCNNGAADLIAPYPVKLYANALTGTLLLDTSVNAVLPRGGCDSMRVTLAVSQLLANGVSEVVAVVNGSASGVGQAAGLQMECNIDNNSGSATIIAIVHGITDTTVCANVLPLTWHDSVFTAEGTKITHLVAVGGADSVLQMNLHLYPSYTGIDDYDTVIQNILPSMWRGITFTEAGDKTTTLASVHGCDSTVTMHLHVWINKATTVDSTICDNTFPFTWNGVTFASAGQQQVTLLASHGEDSVVTMNVYTYPTFTVSDYDTVIENNLPYTWETLTFSAAGDQTATLASEHGCDSVVTMHLHVWLNKTATADSTICDNTFPLTWNGVVFNAADQQPVTLTAMHGEDSVLTMNVYTYPTFTVDDYDTIVENRLPYTWEGLTFTAADDQTTTLTSMEGCDSVVTMHLHVWPNLAALDDSVVCDNQVPLVWNGVEFRDAGVQQATLTAMHGEDSVVTMTLRVNATFVSTETAVICDNQTYPFHGSNYNQAGSYTKRLDSRDGCDSVVTLRLSVNRTYNHTTSQAVCANASFDWGTPRRTIWQAVGIDGPGANQTHQINETDRLQSIDGCDSISSLNLTIHSIHRTPTEQTICFGEAYMWRGRTLRLNSEQNNVELTAVFTDTLTTRPYGCDSVLQLTLTQHAHPVVTFTKEQSCVYTVDLTVDAPYHVITSNPPDPNLVGHEQELHFETSPRETTYYTVHTDISEVATCPWEVGFRLIPITPAIAIIKTSPEVLTASNLELHLYDRNSAKLKRHWFIDGVEQSDTSWHIIYNADIDRDSVLVGLSVFNHTCGDTATTTVYIRHEDIFAPNTFSPQFEEPNNRFRVVGKDLLSGELSVYNREGILVFRSEDIEKGWDGEGCAGGVYVWHFRYTNKGTPNTTQVASGTLTLIR